MAPTETGGGPAALPKFSRLRRGSSDKNASTASLGTSSGTSDGMENKTKPGMDSTFERLRSRTRRGAAQTDDERRGSGDSGRRLSKLMPGKRGRPKKTPSSENLERPLSAYSSLPGNQSDSSIGVNGSGHSSLLTDDNSEQEG